MKRKELKNFYLIIDDVALNKTIRDGVIYIETSFTKDDRRCLFRYPTLEYACGDISEEEINYLRAEIQRNFNLLRGQKLTNG